MQMFFCINNTICLLSLILHFNFYSKHNNVMLQPLLKEYPNVPSWATGSPRWDIGLHISIFPRWDVLSLPMSNLDSLVFQTCFLGVGDVIPPPPENVLFFYFLLLFCYYNTCPILGNLSRPILGNSDSANCIASYLIIPHCRSVALSPSESSINTL